MKRIVCLLSAFCLLFIVTACGQTERTLVTDYSGGIQTTDGQMNCTGILHSEDGALMLTLTSPATVAGVRYEFRDGETHTALNGLDCITPSGSLPASSVPALIEEVFSRSDEAEYLSTDDGIDTFTLKTRCGTATVTAQDGVPLTVTQGIRRIRFTGHSDP